VNSPGSSLQPFPGLPYYRETPLDIAGAVSIGTDAELYALKEAGKRMSEALNLRLIFDGPGVTGRWMAFALADGRSDNVLYDTRSDAIRHQFHETFAHYEQMRPKSWSADECAMTLQYARAAYDAGWRPEPDAPAPIKPVRLEDQAQQLRRLRRNKRR
jgi:hypothetical protein